MSKLFIKNIAYTLYIEYSEEYMDEFKIHYYSFNRKNHFPYIYRVSLLTGDIEKVKKLFTTDARPEKKAS